MKKVMIAAALPMAMLASAGAQAMDIDAGVNVGTLGVGPELGLTIVPEKFRARLTTGFMNYSDSVTSEGIEYDGDLELRNAGLLADYHPFGGYFRLTGGAIFNDNSFSATGVVQDGQTYTADGQTYTAQSGDSVHADVDFNAVAPYVGIGWSSANNKPGLSFRADLGVMYQGSPSASIDVNTSDPAAQAQADRYAAEAESDLNDELDNFKLYPVFQVGMLYRF